MVSSMKKYTMESAIYHEKFWTERIVSVAFKYKKQIKQYDISSCCCMYKATAKMSPKNV